MLLCRHRGSSTPPATPCLASRRARQEVYSTGRPIPTPHRPLTSTLAAYVHGTQRRTRGRTAAGASMVARSITRSSQLLPQALQAGRGFAGRTEKAHPARGMLDRGLAAVHLLLSPHDRILPSFGSSICRDSRRALVSSRRHGPMLLFSCRIFLGLQRRAIRSVITLLGAYKLLHM